MERRSDYTFKYNTKMGRHGWLRLTPAYSIKLVKEILHSNDLFGCKSFDGGLIFDVVEPVEHLILPDSVSVFEPDFKQFARDARNNPHNLRRLNKPGVTAPFYIFIFP